LAKAGFRERIDAGRFSWKSSVGSSFGDAIVFGCFGIGVLELDKVLVLMSHGSCRLDICIGNQPNWN
jgi:hypothetical protein